MSVAPKPFAETSDEPMELRSGDRMSREEFHRIYSRMPEHFKAELIGGTVYVASPLGRKHGTTQPPISAALFCYSGSTPGAEMGNNTTVLLGDDSEPQPDLYLRILPEFGGQSGDSADDYVKGAPELVVEVAVSSRSIDLNAKREDYARYGVREYLVLLSAKKSLRWFDLAAGREMQIGPDGVLRSIQFPGLWIHVPSLFAKDSQTLLRTLQEGMRQPEYAAFASRLLQRPKGLDLR